MTAAAAAPPPVFGPRLAAGLAGVLLAAMMAGLGTRVGGLALADMRGALGWGADEGAWLQTVYLAGELVAMPFSCWLAITFSLRRFHLGVVAAFAALALIMPWVRDFFALLVLRAAQGLAGGLLIPVLMMAALRFLPPPIRLHGLALYALTATFAPNLGVWLYGQWGDVLADWRWTYWQSLLLAPPALLLAGWGLPQDPPQLGRLRQANWFGLVCAGIGLGMLAIGLDRGARLDWWRSDLIIAMLAGGGLLVAVFLLSEYFHPAPFLKPQLMGRRNLAIGFSAFVLLLTVMLSGSLLPAVHLERIWGYRSLQSAPIGLIVALPQLVLGSAVAWLLYRSWVDARHVFAGGLALIGTACLLGTRITVDWTWQYFLLMQGLHAFGQPMAVVAMLFLCTGVVSPPEGQYVAGTVNTIRAFGSLFGGAVLGHFLTLRERWHSDHLADAAGQNAVALEPSSLPGGLESLAGALQQQAWVLAAADGYRLLAALSFLLIIPVLCLQRLPAPGKPPPAASVAEPLAVTPKLED